MTFRRRARCCTCTVADRRNWRRRTQRAVLTPSRDSAWLDKHEEAEAWAGVEATLDAYAARRGAEAAADPACRAMRELGAKLAARERDETV